MLLCNTGIPWLFAADQFCILPALTQELGNSPRLGGAAALPAGQALTARVRVALNAVLASCPGAATPQRALPSSLPSPEPAAPLEPRTRASRCSRQPPPATGASALRQQLRAVCGDAQLQGPQGQASGVGPDPGG